MTISERLFTIMKNKKVTQEKMANALGIAQPTVGHWKTRGTTPPMEYLPTICEVLDISWNYLVTGEEATTGTQLAIDEEHLLKNYRRTSDKGRGRIQECAREMVQLYPALPNDLDSILATLGEKEIVPAETIPFPSIDERTLGLVRAGTGIHKPNTEVAKKADIPRHTDE